MTPRPAFLTDRPDLQSSPQPGVDRPDSETSPMQGDILSDVMKAVRLAGVAFVDIDASAPWSARTPPAKSLIPVIMPGAQHLMSYHLVTVGHVWVVPEAGAPMRVAAGEVVVFPHGEAHIVSSDPALPPRGGLDPYRLKPTKQLPYQIRGGGGGAGRTRMICGFLGCDARPFNPLLAGLPRILHVGDDGADDSGGMLGQFYRLAVDESNARRPGSDAVLARLSELMFVEVVRRHLASLPAESAGWLAGLRDRQIGHALALIHARPAEPWTLDGLAKEAGLSRTLFADRFHRFVGLPAINYLMNWRIQLASRRLADGEANIATVALEVGYESEAAFSRAFKKLVGVPPATWRRSLEAPAD
jgi:AraC-like DNA-binding protein